MSTRSDITIPLSPDYYYHIFNRGNNKRNIFLSEANYSYFLSQLKKYMGGYFHFYVFALLPNHFHLLIRVKDRKTIIKSAMKDFPNGIRKIKKEEFANKLHEYSRNNKTEFLEMIVSEKFRRFFLSYAKSINKENNFTGSLFQKYFRRKRITTEEYLKELVWYIHNNPEKHNICKSYKKYQWSSYQSFLSGKDSLLMRQEVFDWFENRENFIAYHELRSKNEAF